MKSSDGLATIYRIICVPTGEFYVGCTAAPVRRRWLGHRGPLRQGKHSSKNFQRAWDRYGTREFIGWCPEADANFKVEELERCEVAIMFARERYYMELLGPTLNTQVPM